MFLNIYEFNRTWQIPCIQHCHWHHYWCKRMLFSCKFHTVWNWIAGARCHVHILSTWAASFTEKANVQDNNRVWDENTQRRRRASCVFCSVFDFSHFCVDRFQTIYMMKTQENVRFLVLQIHSHAVRNGVQLNHKYRLHIRPFNIFTNLWNSRFDIS